MNSPFTAKRRVWPALHPVRIVAALCALGVLTSNLLAADITEPPLVVFGKVIHVDQGATYQLMDGTLRLTLTNNDDPANSVTRTVQLRPSGSGAFSYRIQFPQGTMLTPQEISSTLVVGTAPTAYFLAAASVNSVIAEPLDAVQGLVETAFANRGQEHRLDLRVSLPQADSDGDGIPDWYEDLNGLNSHFAGDATLDVDGDGWDALAEFTRNTAPDISNVDPEIGTTSILVPAGGVSGLFLSIHDSDSSPAQLELKISSAVTGLGFATSSGPLSPGASFTYADVLAGEITLSVAPDFTEDTMPLTIDDTFGTNGATAFSVFVQAFSPANQGGRGPAAWLSADDPEGILSDGDPVAEWLDGSSSGRDGYQPYAPNQPQLGTGVVPRVVFSGDDFLYVDDRDLDLGTLAGFLAFSVSDIPTNNQVLFSSSDLLVVVGGTDDPLHAHALYVVQDGREIAGPVVPTNELIQLTLVGGAVSSFVTVGGGSLYPSASGGGLSPAYTTIGSRQDFGQVQQERHLRGAIHEVLLYGEILDPGHCSRNEDYQRSRWGELIVWDYRNETAPVQLTGHPGVRNALNTGWGADTLNGSELDDTLRGGPSADSLTGNGGADRFQFFPGHGDDTVFDFTESEGDIIDLSPIFADRRGSPTNFLVLSIQVTRDTNNIPRADTIIDIDEDGDGTADQRITLVGVTYSDADLPRLTGEGVIQLGGPQFETSLALTASETALIETEVARTLTLTRSGNLAAAMDVQLSFVGSAAVSSDYALTNAAGSGMIRTVSFARGESALAFDLTPIQDSLSESEVIQVAILPLPEVTSLPSSALTLTLDDAPEIAIEALVGYTIKGGPSPGIVMITRTGPTDQQMDVKLAFSGADNGIDYVVVSPVVAMTTGVSSVQFDVSAFSPSPLTNLPTAAEFSIVEDKTRYAVAAAGMASVYILGSLDDQWQDYGIWQGINISSGTSGFAGDAEGDGLLNGLEYVYGTDPSVATTDPMAGRIELVNAGGFIEIRLTTVSPLTDVELAIDATSDLTAGVWVDVTGSFTLSTSDLTSPYMRRSYRSNAPAANDGRYYRLRITPIGAP